LSAHCAVQAEKVNSSCGMHVHVDASKHTPQSLKNVLSIMYSKEDILFAALKVNPARIDSYCQAVDEPILEEIRKLPSGASMDQLKDRWYQGRDGSDYASGVILPYLQSLRLKDMVIASPDVGGSKRANTYAKYFGCPLVLCNKTRARANVVASMQIIGDVKDKNVVIIDDMVDTAGTITKAADIMKQAGAKTVRACASHCVMSGPASERVQDSALEEIVFTDSIPYTKRCAKVKQISIADMFAETIRRVEDNESISSQYLV